MSDNPNMPDLAGPCDVRAAIGLNVQSDNLGYAHDLDAFRQQIDLCADQVGDGDRGSSTKVESPGGRGYPP
jgi:hypothetical protein